jgi:hypothetical protein
MWENTMALLQCPHLGTDIEFNDERERHIRDHHPDLLPAWRDRMIETVADPDQVRRSTRVGNAKLFSKWYANLRGGQHVVVVVVSDPGQGKRPWIITAYLARKLKEGEIEWRKS